MKTQSILILMGIVFSSISFQAQNLDWEKRIIGNWIFIKSNENEEILKKVKEFEINKSGMAFFENGAFIYRTYSGFCGTPPRTRSNNHGTWEKFHNEVLVANYKNWNGTKELKIFIKAVDNNQLIIQFIKNNIEK